MTQTIAVNSQGDIYVAQNGNLAMLQQQPAVQATCRSTSLARLGEEVLSVSSGLPFFQAVFIGVPNLAIFENYLRQALEQVNGVLAVTNLSSRLTKVNGKVVLNYTATIENIYGLIFTISQQVSP